MFVWKNTIHFAWHPWHEPLLPGTVQTLPRAAPNEALQQITLLKELVISPSVMVQVPLEAWLHSLHRYSLLPLAGRLFQTFRAADIGESRQAIPSWWKHSR